MMKLSARFMLVRRSSSVVAFPLALVLTAIYVSSSYIDSGIDGYWESASIRATSSLLFIAPIISAASAWEIVRLRKGGALTYPATRSVGRVLLRSLGPTVFVSVICLAAGWTLLALGLTDGGGLPDYRVFLMGAAVLIGWSAFGSIAGLLLPVVIAAPACLIVAYVALAYPPSVNPPWVRHLTGVNSSCCLDTERIATRAILAPTVLAAGVVVAAVAFFVVRNRIVSSVIALCAVTVSVQVGVHLVQSFGPDPVVARSTSELLCARGAIEVCVWPEHKALLHTSLQAAHRIQRVSENVVEVPRVVSEGPGKWQFALTQDLSPEGVLESLVIGIFPQQPPASCRGGDWQSSRAVPLLEAWIEKQVGVTSDQLSGLHSPAVLSTLDDIRKQSESQQHTLMRQLQSAVVNCTKLPLRLG